MAKWLSTLLLMTMVGCSSDPTPVVSQYTLAVSSDNTVNPSDSNEANPVAVRLYQLTDAQMFNQLPFIDLYSNDVTLLSANLVSKQILPMVIPNTKVTHTLDINSTTQYVAILVEFIDYQNSEAKAFSTLPLEEDQFLQLTIEGATASLNIVTPDSSWWQLF